MTGWGQDGPYAAWSGHDINYIALAGCLAHIGNAEGRRCRPSTWSAISAVAACSSRSASRAALLEAQKSGKGQVVDAAMVDGAAILMSMFHGFLATGMWNNERGTNLLDTGAHFYDTYECADGNYVSIGSIEPQFYAELLRITGLSDDPGFAKQMDRGAWPELKERLREVFLTKTRDEWCALMEHTDVCFAPVLTIPEAAAHPHNVARSTFVEVGGISQPAPAPRFSRHRSRARPSAVVCRSALGRGAGRLAVADC